MKKTNDTKQKTYNCILCGNPMEFAFEGRGYFYHHCPSCDLLSTYPLPTNKEMEKHYKKKFDEGNYELLRQYADQYKKVYAVFVDRLEKQLKSMGTTIKGKKVLDIGCFTGEFLELMKEKGADVYGVELQDDAVKIANKKLNNRVIQADVMTDAFPKIKFDIITLFGLIEHVTDPVKLIKRCHQLLKDGGLIMFQTPNSGSFLAKRLKKSWPPLAPVEHIHLFSRKSLEQTLQKQGFEVTEFKSHAKKLPVGYVYNQFRNFGPQFYKLLKPFDKVISLCSNVGFPFYIGEMMMIAKKTKS